jgi:hypothetical protein
MRADGFGRTLVLVLSVGLCIVATPVLAVEMPPELDWWSDVSEVWVAAQFGMRGGESGPWMAVGLHSGIGADPIGALVIYSEPSHTLLFAQVNSELPRFHDLARAYEAQGAMVLGWGGLASFQQRFPMPRAWVPPKSDDSISAAIRWAGREYTVARAFGHVDDFDFSTRFRQARRGEDFVIEFVQHCCWGTHCGQMCITCPTAWFFCNLIDCSIECLDM